MAKAVLTLIVVLSVGHTTHHQVHITAAKPITASEDKELLQKLARDVDSLTRQVMLQQLFVEERIRSDGDSGLKQIRQQKDGTRAYFSEDHGGRSIASIHDHANNIRVVGMGELTMVMNGVEFRTRHNDYPLRMSDPRTDTYNSLIDIPFPRVPPEVSAKRNVNEQIAEMQEWFKAWKNEDHSVRNYRKYFKPVLCYLEAGWTTNTETIEEPFLSDRHHIDASSWFDLQDKIRFTSYSGAKDIMENYAYLPTTIMDVINGTTNYAQWNYRIACHPIKEYLPIRAFQLVDDVKERVSNFMNITEYANSRKARFTLTGNLGQGPNVAMQDRVYTWGLLDDLMHQIPGKDGYKGKIEDNAFRQTAYHIKSSDPKRLTRLNTAFYHRWYKSDLKDAMGQTNTKTGFADRNLFVARTTQRQIAPMTARDCKTQRVVDTDNANRNTKERCTTYNQRYTYAVPLEIIYLTPLCTWNPYKIADRGDASKAPARAVTSGGRNGGFTPDKAYNGTHSRLHYWTPNTFFSSGEVDPDIADTAKGTVGVLDWRGVVRKVTASGTRIFLPKIEGVGKLRTRYPIMPIHAEGSAAWKELEALKAMVMDIPKYSSLFKHDPTDIPQNDQDIRVTILHVPPTTRYPPGLHSHEIELQAYEIQDLKDGKPVRGIFTSISNGHQHTIDIVYDKATKGFKIARCDGLARCWDGHDFHLILE